MTSTVPDLPVPDEAVSALVQAFQDDYDELVNGQLAHEERVRTIAAPVLAAWVEQVAAEWDDQRWSTTPRAMAKVLRDRLAELDPEETP